MIQGDSPGAELFDLGYARHLGHRGGRRAAFVSLYLQGLRGVFGLGRRNAAKILPVGLAVLTLIPAAVQLGIAAIASNAVQVLEPQDYYVWIRWLLVLFVAATSTELLGRDVRHQVLALYFARGLRRVDYVAARTAALTTALLGLTLVPQAVLFVGTALADESPVGYMGDHWKDLAPIVLTASVLSAYLSSISLAVSSTTGRRAFAAGGILAYFALSRALGFAAVGFGAGALREWGLIVSGLDAMHGFTTWVFGDEAQPSTPLGEADLALQWYGVALALVTAGSWAYLMRSYRRRRL